MSSTENERNWLDVIVGVPLIIVTCGYLKAPAAREARRLYIGPYATACRSYGEQLARQKNGEWVILSAKYGFVEPSRIIAPYDVTFGTANAITLEQLRVQAERLGFDRPVYVVGGSRYVAMMQQLWPHARRAIEETRGIGHQLAWLGREIKREEE